MKDTITNISAWRIVLMAIPAIPVFLMLHRWNLNFKKSFYAVGRMLLQLITIGFVLSYLFSARQSYLVLITIFVMMLAATWISLNPLRRPSKILYWYAFLSIILAGSITLVIVTVGILQADPWYQPRLIIPLAGMVYVVSMNAISLSAERLMAELENRTPLDDARKSAARAALIPTINSLLAVGLVSLPGMMTGQILSGVDPLIAVRYQIVVMLMGFVANGLTTFLFLTLSREHFSAFEWHGDATRT
ncbi:ABC transporter permease [uncultured Cohaesibacter sp.]|uniref:ABC transporter permease n=1 Tax=uncultured Cohaesibacter sp. TaxID=1002546 RepID=UPI0029C7470B|nr:ABC transporter permease [uncultured Cohaesibacter sp.]